MQLLHLYMKRIIEVHFAEKIENSLNLRAVCKPSSPWIEKENWQWNAYEFPDQEDIQSIFKTGKVNFHRDKYFTESFPLNSTLLEE